MIISHTRKFIFIKSRKTGGTSVEAALSQQCAGPDVVTPLGDYSVNRDVNGTLAHRALNAGDFQQHADAATIKSKVPPMVWDEYFKFSIARNPWDRIVSDFSWRARNRPELQPRRSWYHRLGVPFDEFEATRRFFQDFVTGDEWTTNDRFYLLDGSLCVDFVIRYERLTEDLAEVCRRVGLAAVELPRLKSGLRKGGHSYRDYYDEKSRAIVADRHRNDIRLFSYEF